MRRVRYSISGRNWCCMRRCARCFGAAWNWRGRGACCAAVACKWPWDTTPIWGRGAVKDTYNLLADGIRQLLRTLARVQDRELAPWAAGQGYARYLAASVKGTAEIDWDEPTAREAFLAEIVADADRLLAAARDAQAGCAADSPERGQIVAAAQLLGQLLHQDVARSGPGRTPQGVSQDRIVSVHDPEMRHGRKSSSQRFDGHKAAVAVDPESQLITAVAVLPGNAPDAQGALELVAQSERHIGVPVTETIADAAYGDGHTRQQFADAGRTLIAKVPKRPARSHFPKEDFQIDLTAGTRHLSGRPGDAYRAAAGLLHHDHRRACAAALFPL